jgi:hypothetical protein
MQEIIIEINPEARTVKLETSGYTGQDCLADTAALKEALGAGISQEVKPQRGMARAQASTLKRNLMQTSFQKP